MTSDEASTLNECRALLTRHLHIGYGASGILGCGYSLGLRPTRVLHESNAVKLRDLIGRSAPFMETSTNLGNGIGGSRRFICTRSTTDSTNRKSLCQLCRS